MNEVDDGVVDVDGANGLVWVITNGFAVGGMPLLLLPGVRKSSASSMNGYRSA